MQSVAQEAEVALVLYVKEGGRFYLGNTPVDVLHIDSGKHVDLEVRQEPPEFMRVAGEPVEVLGGVFMHTDIRVFSGRKVSTARLVIEAPQEVRILSEERWVAARNSGVRKVHVDKQ